MNNKINIIIIHFFKNTRDGDYAELVFDGSDKSSAVGGDQQDRAQVDGTVVNYADIRK